MITGLRDIFVYTADMERSLAFYRDVLGLRVVHQTPYWTTLDLGGIRFGLHWTGGAPVPEIAHNEHGPLCGCTVTFAVRDVEALVAHLNTNNARLVGPLTEHDWGRIATFADPDGNVVKFMQAPESSP